MQNTNGCVSFILVVDDQYPGDEAARATFSENTNTAEHDSEASAKGIIARTVFCPGQRVSEKEAVNDYVVIHEAISNGTPDGTEWSLILLDGCFFSGRKNEFGLVEGNYGDEKFGAYAKERIREDFPHLPVLMISSSKHAPPYIPKRELTSEKLLKFLLEYGHLTDKERSFLLPISTNSKGENEL